MPKSKNSKPNQVEFWRAIKDSCDVEDFELYLKNWPRGKFSGEAKKKIFRILICG